MCLYDVEERLLLRRIQISFNRSLDGILDSLDSRKVTDAGPLALIDDSGSDDDGLLPSVAPGGPDCGTMCSLIMTMSGRAFGGLDCRGDTWPDLLRSCCSWLCRLQQWVHTVAPTSGQCQTLLQLSHSW